MQNFKEFDLDEAHKIGSSVEVIKGSGKGIKGHIGEIRHGAFKGAAKTYTVYHGEHDAIQVPKEHIRAVKEELELDEARMSAALRMANAIDKQRAKSDASRARTPSSIPKKEEPKKQGVAEASDRMQRYGQLILKRKAEQNAAAQAAKPQPKKEEPPASSDYDSMSTRDFMKQLRDQRRPKKKGVAEGLVKDIKRLATGKDVKSRAGQEIAKSQDASMKGDTKTSKKHFDRYDKLDKLANKEQGVAEAFRPMDEPRYDLSIEARQKRADNAAKAKKEEPKKQGAAKGLKEDNEHYDKAEEHLSKANDAEAKGHMKSFHAHMADHHDAMSEWHDSKGRSASADKHADKAEMHHEKSLTVKEDIDLNEDRIPKNHTIEAHGIRGMKATPWRKTFKNHEHLSDWADKNDSVEVHATRDLGEVKKKTNEELSFTLSFKEFIEEESPSDKFKKYVRPVVKTTPKIERDTNPSGRTNDHVEWKVTTHTGEVHRHNSKKEAQAHFDSLPK